MKKMNKYAAIMLAATMTLGMSSTVFADTTTTDTYDTSNLTIDTVYGHTYKVYQLLKGDVSSLNNGTGKLANVEAGSNLKSDTTADAFIAAVKDQTGLTLSTTAWSYVSGDAVESVDGVADKEDTKDVDESLVSVEVTDGYYVVEDTAAAGKVVSRYMVAVVGDTAMAPKNSDVPEVQKKVKDANDTTDTAATEHPWQDSADYDIGDEIPFELTATLPEDYDQYNTYYLSFNDNMSDGLTLEASTIKVYVDGVLQENNYYIYGTQQKFEVVFYDLKTAVPAAKNSSTVVVDYTAVLNSSAVIGSAGNPNTVTLTYNNNPNITTKDSDADGTPDDDYPTPGTDTPGTPTYTPEDKDGDGTPDNPDSPKNEGNPDKPTNPGETTPDKNVVFTYEVDANKVTKNESNETVALKGAAFELYKKVGDAWTLVGIQNATKGTDGKYTIVDANATTFAWTGIDDGTYKIVEVITPEGYNDIADQIFTVEATHDTTSDDPQLTKLEATTDTGSTIELTAGLTETKDENDKVVSTKYDGTLNTDILNLSGTVLPSTGGIGTTIFYVAGMILVLGAGVLLVTRRRIAR